MAKDRISPSQIAQRKTRYMAGLLLGLAVFVTGLILMLHSLYSQELAFDIGLLLTLTGAITASVSAIKRTRLTPPPPRNGNGSPHAMTL